MRSGIFFCIVVVCICSAKRVTIRKQSSIAKPSPITIDVMIHFDPVLSKRLAIKLGSRKRNVLNKISNNLIKQVQSFYNHPSLNQTIKLRLIDTKFLRNGKSVIINEDAPTYLNSYCEWQSRKKTKKLYYSIMLTGLDIFYLNRQGEEMRETTGRSFRNGMCHPRKSCSIIEWRPGNVAYLIAHEMGHSLGLTHDGAPYNNCVGSKHVMAADYDYMRYHKSWSPCSQRSLAQFLRSDKAWCLIEKGEYNTYKY